MPRVLYRVGTKSKSADVLGAWGASSGSSTISGAQHLRAVQEGTAPAVGSSLTSTAKKNKKKKAKRKEGISSKGASDGRSSGAKRGATGLDFGSVLELALAQARSVERAGVIERGGRGKEGKGRKRRDQWEILEARAKRNREKVANLLKSDPKRDERKVSSAAAEHARRYRELRSGGGSRASEARSRHRWQGRSRLPHTRPRAWRPM